LPQKLDRKNTSEEEEKKIGDRRVESDSETNREKRQSKNEWLMFPAPRRFVMLEVRHISLGLPAALQECELLQLLLPLALYVLLLWKGHRQRRNRRQEDHQCV